MLSRLGVGLCAAGVWWLGACSGPPRAAGGPGPGAGRLVRPLAREIPAFPGEALVVLLSTPQEEGRTLPPARWLPREPPEVRARSDGSHVPSRMVWLSAEGLIQPERAWLPASQRWRAWGLDELRALAPGERPVGFGFWALIADVPPTQSGGAFTLEGIGLAVRWFSPPPTTTIVARAPRLGAAPDAFRRLGERLSAEMEDPLRRWRVELITDRIRPFTLFGPEPPGPFEDPVMRALSQHYESRWRAALDVLAEEDPDLASDLTTLLTCVVLSPDGEVLPAWPLDSSDASLIQETLLSQRTSASEKADLAREWLNRQARAVEWVVDESGPDSGAGPDQPGWIRREVRIGLSERWGRRGVASFAPVGSPARNATRLGGHESVELSAALLLSPSNDPGVGVARVGPWAREVPVLGQRLEATPPGLIIGPLWRRWTMADWLSRRPAPARLENMAICLLERLPDGSWWLFVECRAEPGRTDDVVTVRLGAGSTRVSVDAGPGAPDGPAIEWAADRWTARFAIDEKQVQEGSLLRLGVTRRRGEEAWSWPRPLLPGQLEPGRAVIGLDAWGSLAEPDQAAPASPSMSDPDASS